MRNDHQTKIGRLRWPAQLNVNEDGTMRIMEESKVSQ